MKLPLFQPQRYEPIHRFNIQRSPEWGFMGSDEQEAVRVVSQVLPFRTNTYVTRNLINWDRNSGDPMFNLTFPQREMIDEEDFSTLQEVLNSGASRDEVKEVVQSIRRRLNPHPAGQLSHNVPELNGRKLEGLQHKYRETVLFFPSQGQTCHAYCTYCFRWPQFVGNSEVRFQSRSSDDLVRYLREREEVTDLLITGGDPLVMKASLLESYLAPVLEAQIEHLKTIRLGSKALAYWPFRFLTDPDSDDLLRLFERVVKAGKHLALMAHFSHPVELSTAPVEEAIRRVRSAGAEIRMQAPLVRHVNDSSDVWAALWKQGVHLGLVPYYMFVERDTGPKGYFEIPLHRAHLIFREAFNQVSGLARTVRGPSMSAFPGKVHLIGTAQIGREKVFVLQFLQARDPNWVGRPFFARFDPEACWLDDLTPAFGRKHFFFEREYEPTAVSTVA
ncbi:MAG: lysine 2,3-aminomutase [Acidobacteriota bacterium]|nr:MAG: lysine 2,3-aminomutase [Acidobacteriota bacterium]